MVGGADCWRRRRGWWWWRRRWWWWWRLWCSCCCSPCCGSCCYCSCCGSCYCSCCCALFVAASTAVVCAAGVLPLLVFANDTRRDQQLNASGRKRQTEEQKQQRKQQQKSKSGSEKESEKQSSENTWILNYPTLHTNQHQQTLSGSRMNTFNTLCKSRFDSRWQYQPGAECRACRLRRPPTDCQTEEMRFAGSTSSSANWTWNSKSSIKSDTICTSSRKHGRCHNFTKCH